MDSASISSISLIIGCAADFIFADPPRLPNPVRLYGAIISRGDTFLNSGNRRLIKGAFLAVALVTGVFCFFFLLDGVAASAGDLFYVVFSSLFIFFGLSGAGLIRECGAIFPELESGDILSARRRLSRLVGRDTGDLSAARIKAAVLETMSENLSDGVVAPVFFYMLGGIPAMMAYKAVNTLDSMIGYKNSRYRKFGMAAAKIDDAANFIPARLTAFVMAGCAFSRRAFVFILKFGSQHPSPNAGFPQAALAGILDRRFGGPASYGGKTVEKPFIGENPEEITADDFETAKKINNTVMVVSVTVAAVSGFVF